MAFLLKLIGSVITGVTVNVLVLVGTIVACAAIAEHLNKKDGTPPGDTNPAKVSSDSQAKAKPCECKLVITS